MMPLPDSGATWLRLLVNPGLAPGVSCNRSPPVPEAPGFPGSVNRDVQPPRLSDVRSYYLAQLEASRVCRCGRCERCTECRSQCMRGHRSTGTEGRGVSESRAPRRQLSTRHPAERFRTSREVGGRDSRQSASHRCCPVGAGLLRDHDSQARPSSDHSIRRRSVPAPPGLSSAELKRSGLTDPGRKPGVHEGGCSTERERQRAPC
jgi:hypothetical protein